MIFVRNAPAPLADLESTLWVLEALLQDDVATSVAGDPATLRLEDGSLTGATGCRTLAGSYVVFGNEIILTDFGASGDCPTSLRDQDGSIVTVLGDGFVPTIDGDQLTLISEGNQGLRYRATTADAVAGLDSVASPSDAELLDGVVWVFAGGDSPGGLIVDPRTISDQQITLTLSDGSFSGEVNCNAYGGDVEIGNGQWTFSIPFTEEEDCGDELDAIAQAYLSALPLMSEFGIEAGGDRLTTNGSDIDLSFERSE